MAGFEVAVVGAGRSGLGAAARLAEAGRATVLLERLPAPGGRHPGAAERELARRAERAGAELVMGTLAVRWSPGALETLGVDGGRTLACSVLVVATGTRPATRGELGVDGDRCAGVLPAPAAIHLTESGVMLGRRPLVYGEGDEARECAELLVRAGAERVTLVSPSGLPRGLPDAVDGLAGWRLATLEGVGRVAAARIDRDGRRERIAADAVVLATGRIRMRNIEGAVLPGPGVVDCHSDEVSPEDAARGAVHAVLRAEGAES